MKTPTTIILLFGVLLVQSLVSSKSVKTTSEFKDWTHNKQLLTKLANDSIDDIKQGNRTKKSLLCIDVQSPESQGCPPGCDSKSSSPEEQPVITPAPISGPMLIPAVTPVPVLKPMPSGKPIIFQQIHSKVPQKFLRPQVVFPIIPQPPGLRLTPQKQQIICPPIPQAPPNVPQLPPCPPEENYVYPGVDSQEIISYEVVPIKHHIPSVPFHVVTTEKPAYPCLPLDVSQLSTSQLSTGPLTAVQQQSAMNQIQVVQANAYDKALGPDKYNQPYGISTLQNQGYSDGGSTMTNSGGYTQIMGNQKPTVVSNGQVVDCVDVPSTQGGAYGFQSSQSMAQQSYAAAQSAAYSGYGLTSFRFAEDANEVANATIPQLYQTEIPHNHQFSSPSSQGYQGEIPHNHQFSSPSSQVYQGEIPHNHQFSSPSSQMYQAEIPHNHQFFSSSSQVYQGEIPRNHQFSSSSQ